MSFFVVYLYCGINRGIDIWSKDAKVFSIDGETKNSFAVHELKLNFNNISFISYDSTLVSSTSFNISISIKMQSPKAFCLDQWVQI